MQLLREFISENRDRLAAAFAGTAVSVAGIAYAWRTRHEQDSLSTRLWQWVSNFKWPLALRLTHRASGNDDAYQAEKPRVEKDAAATPVSAGADQDRDSNNELLSSPDASQTPGSMNNIDGMSEDESSENDSGNDSDADEKFVRAAFSQSE